MSNSFTFNAVPSAIVHADCIPVLVNCNSLLVIDTDDLIQKIEETDAKVLMLSYMRGRIPNMDIILEICNKYSIYLIEDAAHSYGAEWNGKPICGFGIISCISTQANKIINSGEGGFLITNNEDIMAKAIISTGCYEELFKKHNELCPDINLMYKYRMNRVNYSIRMTNLQGAIILPQIYDINNRRQIFNQIYQQLCSELNIPEIFIPKHLVNVLPVCDSFQFKILGINTKQLHIIINKMNLYNYKIDVFSFIDNARNWKTWKFINNLHKFNLEKTDNNIYHMCDMRININMKKPEIIDFKHKLLECINSIT